MVPYNGQAPDVIVLNSLWLSDTIWWHGSGSALVQVMACWLTAPSHYLSQCWHLITEVLWYLPERNFSASAQLVFCITSLKLNITTTSPMGQWVNFGRHLHLKGFFWEWIQQQCESQFGIHMLLLLNPMGWFNIKTPPYQYRDSNYKDEMVMRLSYLYVRNSYNW